MESPDPGYLDLFSLDFLPELPESFLLSLSHAQAGSWEVSEIPSARRMILWVVRTFLSACHTPPQSWEVDMVSPFTRGKTELQRGCLRCRRQHSHVGDGGLA
jgi:hypothetical protein